MNKQEQGDLISRIEKKLDPTESHKGRWAALGRYDGKFVLSEQTLPTEDECKEAIDDWFVSRDEMLKAGTDPVFNIAGQWYKASLMEWAFPYPVKK